MKAFKLFRVLKDGNITSLFINKTEKLKLEEWLEAKSYPTEGYKVRPFFHCMDRPAAPHLTNKGRIWLEVEIEEFTILNCPKHQGGVWYLAQKMYIYNYKTNLFNNETKNQKAVRRIS